MQDFGKITPWVDEGDEGDTVYFIFSEAFVRVG